MHVEPARTSLAYNAARVAAAKHKKTERKKVEKETTVSPDSFIQSEESRSLKELMVTTILKPELSFAEKERKFQELTLEDALHLKVPFSAQASVSMAGKLHILIDLLYDPKYRSIGLQKEVIELLLEFYDQMADIQKAQYLAGLEQHLPVLAKHVSPELIVNTLFEMMFDSYGNPNPLYQQALMSFFREIVKVKQLRKLYQAALREVRKQEIQAEFKPTRVEQDVKLTREIEGEFDIDEEDVYKLQVEHEAEHSKNPLRIDDVHISASVFPYVGEGEPVGAVHTSGAGFVLHHSVSFAKAKAYYSELDIFRLHAHPTEEELEKFFKELSERGFTHIYALMPDPKLSDDYEKCMRAKTDAVQVIDTQSFGLGIGLLLHYGINVILKNHNAPTSETWMNKAVDKLRHWIIRLKPNERRVLFVDKRHKPSKTAETLNEAFKIVQNDIEADGYRRLIIIHNTPYKDDVVSWAYELRAEYPNLGIFIRHRSNRQTRYLKQHISIAML